MYIMQLEILGMKMRLEVVVLSMVVGALLGCHLLCSCSKVSATEGMQVLGAALDYSMGKGVSNSYENKEQAKGPSVAWRAQNHDSYNSKLVTPNESMSFFADTEFAPECCGSTYSSNGGLTMQGVTGSGCACLSKSQMEYINERGGNRTPPSDF